MRRRSLLHMGYAAACAATIGAAAPARSTPSDSEAKAIEALIERVAAMAGITFVRNGSEATPAAAARHLRDKYAYFRKDIATAEDFIRLCGTRSELTGRVYSVRFRDGTERPAADLLREQLRDVRSHGR
jgi:hypothetical protein